MPANIFEFGEFRLDCGRFELRRNGQSLRLERKPLELLILLAEKKGQLATRDEIAQRLWQGEVYVDTEHGINTAVRKIRYALRDDPEEARFIQTVTGKGYRFAAPLKVISDLEPGWTHEQDRGETPLQLSGEGGEQDKALAARAAGHPGLRPWIWRGKHRAILLPVAVLVIGLLALLAWLFRPGYPKPRVTGEVQLTADGLWKFGPLATDGLRVYFSEVLNGRETVAAVPIAGGQAVALKLPFAEAGVYDISPSKTDLLIAESKNMYQEAPLWRVPIIGGTPRRLGNVAAHDATWSPDGKKLAYVIGDGLHLANADGSDPRTLLAPRKIPEEWAWRPEWSLDSRRIRFEYYNMETHMSHTWEVNSDGSNPHALFASSADIPMQAYGSWTLDGSYYVFSAWQDVESGVPWPASNLWAVREKADLFHRASAMPEKLTVGPTRYFFHTLSLDGKTIFALSSQKHGELMRFDVHTKTYSLYASGLSAEGISFSRDGQWVAYVKYPQGELWRSRIDGSEALQLSSRPLFASTPSWSPDGRQIAFNGARPGEQTHILLVSTEGGEPRRIDEVGEAVDPTWSPDGTSLAYMAADHDNGLLILNLQTGSIVPVAESKTLIVPRMSPDGRWIVALSINLQKLLLFDMRTQTWRELAKGNILEWPQWSRDSRYIYFARTGPTREIDRVDVGGKTETVVSLKDLRTTGVDPAWFSLTPNGDVLLLHDTGASSEIYALSWDAP